MKSLFIISAVAVALYVDGALAAPAANFVGSCDANSIRISDKILTANCRNIKGQLTCSKLDLGRCLKNSYGSLQADPTGAGPHMSDQCINCSNSKQSGGLVIGGPTPPSLLHCQCNPGTGAAQVNWPTAMFDLNTIVDNNNGVLECYQTKGTAC